MALHAKARLQDADDPRGSTMPHSVAMWAREQSRRDTQKDSPLCQAYVLLYTTASCEAGSKQARQLVRAHQSLLIGARRRYDQCETLR